MRTQMHILLTPARLKAYREAHKVTASELARAMSKRVQTVLDWEDGTYGMSEKVVRDYMDAVHQCAGGLILPPSKLFREILPAEPLTVSVA